jgi:hypothetical protein
MSTLTLTKAPVVPDLERPDADEIGDEILLEAAGKVKTAKVSGAVNGFRQSAEARAWTKSGNVD